MTGLDRLRELAGWADENLQSVWHGSMTLPEELSRIAAEMEGEREALVRESEDISGRDADALAWVEKHGGLDEVVARWAGRVPAGHVRRMAERWKDRRERLAAHARSLEGLLAERRREIARLHAEIESMRPRLMPPDKKWPRYKDGAPVNFDDTMTDLEGFELKVKSVEFHPNGFTLHGDFDQKRWYEDDARIDYPEPKVLDADGAEIRVGDTVYEVDTEGKMWVSALPKPGEYQCVKLRLTNGMFKTLDPCRLTHRAPVLAVDGKPLREGETVWSTDSGTRYTVEKVTDELIPIKCCSEMGSTVSLHPSQLTHERPDSGERLEEDTGKTTCEYYDHADKSTCYDCPARREPRCYTEMSRDLVRRAKALAERDR